MVSGSRARHPLRVRDPDSPAAIGIVCALAEEMGGLRARATSTRAVGGLEVHALELAGAPVLAAVCGIGKVRAAHAASVIVAAGARRALLVVGTCGGLSRGLEPGVLVHGRGAAQVDLAGERGREIPSDPDWMRAWQGVAPGVAGVFLTADRPVLSAWRRVVVARRFAPPSAADMETAGVAHVARATGVPWAALRAVSDRASWFSASEFRRHFPTCAGLAADTVERLVAARGSAAVAPPSGRR